MVVKKIVISSLMVMISMTGALAAPTPNSDLSQSEKFIKLSVPSSDSLHIAYPVYVYKKDGLNWSQINIVTKTITSSGASVYQYPILGGLNQNSGATFKLVAQKELLTSGGWKGCTIGLSNSKINVSNSTCVGAVLNPLPNTNIYNLTLSATDSAMQPIDDPNPLPKLPDFKQSRMVEFINNTDYAEIEISQRCTKSANQGNSACNNEILFNVAKGNSQTFIVPFGYGLISNAFILTAFKVTSESAWTQTGGYGTGEQPYATKLEPTWQAGQTDGIEVTNVDVSIVDGINIGYKVYPSSENGGAYCTWVKPLTPGAPLMTDLFNEANPMAQGPFNINSGATLESICANSNVTVGQESYSLKKMNDSTYSGCMSPCRKLGEAIGTTDPTVVAKYCCSDDYDTGASCRAAGLVNDSAYVTNFHEYTTHTYTYAYDDTVGDFSCPGLTNLVIEFLSN